MVQIQEVVDLLYSDFYKTNWGDFSTLDCMYLSMDYFIGGFTTFDIDYFVALENFPHNLLDQNLRKKL